MFALKLLNLKRLKINENLYFVDVVNVLPFYK